MTILQRSALATLATALLLAGCSSGSPASPGPSATGSPAQELRALDQAAGATTEPATAYDEAFAKLAAHCLEHAPALADEVRGTAAQLKALGSKTQTHLTVLRDVAAAIPDAYPRSNCAPYLGEFVGAQKLTGTVH
ncbi:hypothetical protein [Kitasatospora sp. NPDC051914]|uniref:hypothetical protein n=1 Tax=Kitasatospora sp. NPDC051914 TaxID=3154945 RepID=UPI00343DAE5B